MTVRVSFPLDEQQLARIGDIAAARHETTDQVLADAVANYLDYDAWFVAEVHKGLAEVADGQTRDFDDAAKALRSRMASRTP